MRVSVAPALHQRSGSSRPYRRPLGLLLPRTDGVGLLERGRPSGLRYAGTGATAFFAGTKNLGSISRETDPWFEARLPCLHRSRPRAGPEKSGLYFIASNSSRSQPLVRPCALTPDSPTTAKFFISATKQALFSRSGPEGVLREESYIPMPWYSRIDQCKPEPARLTW